MCCGKGRNIIGLAKKDITAIGLDFSPAAIKEAMKRAKDAKVEDNATFMVQDATRTGAL